MNREPGPEFLLNIALKYSIIENVVSVILFKCILPVSGHVASQQRLRGSNVFNLQDNFNHSNLKNMYSKITLLQHSKEVTVKRRKKAYHNKTMVDFSKDHKFKLNGENVDDFAIKIQIKRSTSPLQRSESREEVFFYLVSYAHID